jgi:CheY-like chemotaxis protein
MESEKTLSVLLIDDDEIDRMRTLRLIRQIQDQTFEVSEAVTMAAGVSALRTIAFDCVLLDFNLPDGTAIDFLDAIDATKGNCPPLILQTVMNDEKKALEVLGHGAQDYLVKGRFDSVMLMRAIRYAIQRDLLIKERNRLAGELQAAAARIQTLEGILPICSYCKKIRNKSEGDSWEPIESFIHKRNAVDFSHGICPDCLKKHHPHLGEKRDA